MKFHYNVFYGIFFFLPPPPHLTQNQNVNYFLVLIGFNYFFRRGWVGGGGNGTQLSYQNKGASKPSLSPMLANERCRGS